MAVTGNRGFGDAVRTGSIRVSVIASVGGRSCVSLASVTGCGGPRFPTSIVGG